MPELLNKIFSNTCQSNLRCSLLAGGKVESLESLKTVLFDKQGEIKISLDLINSIKSHLLCLRVWECGITKLSKTLRSP